MMHGQRNIKLNLPRFGPFLLWHPVFTKICEKVGTESWRDRYFVSNIATDHSQNAISMQKVCSAGALNTGRSRKHAWNCARHQALLNDFQLWWAHLHISRSIKQDQIKIHRFIFCRQCILLLFLVNDQLDARFFSMYLFQFSTCFKQPFRVQVGNFLSDLHTKRSPTQIDIYQMLYWYNWFSWWCARGCSKHVGNWNKYTEKNRASSWSFTKNN